MKEQIPQKTMMKEAILTHSASAKQLLRADNSNGTVTPLVFPLRMTTPVKESGPRSGIPSGGHNCPSQQAKEQRLKEMHEQRSKEKQQVKDRGRNKPARQEWKPNKVIEEGNEVVNTMPDALKNQVNDMA
ncbi:hypothetical protein K7X08_008540 [Anisodus acutangulus]|uniref:Uncharacterized protein n=1 Tax=Anisodus acutangulus TaxID=402998 RepID=A0A9Q1MQM5_9SOLA|nr:hypothetical protein K7X08_008540 [Anisodus acutangulus]